MSVAKAEAHVWEYTRGADICRIYAIDGHAKSDQHGRRYRRVGRGTVRAISRQTFLTRRRFADSTLWNVAMTHRNRPWLPHALRD